MTGNTGRDLAYCRISLDTKASGSIAKQRERLSAHVVSKGRDPGAVEWFVDESVSGSKVPMRERDGGGRLWAEVRAGDRVLVTKIDRAARSVRDLLNLVEYVSERGASITFIDNDIDTASSGGRLVLTILGAIAEFEAALISERRKDSLEAFANEGRHAVGKAPYGFRSVENPNGRGLVIRVDPDEGPRLREAVSRVMAGEAQDTVRHALGLSKTGFNRLLRNPRLAGMTPDGDGVVMVNGVPRVDAEAALLSMAEWSALNRYLSKDEAKAWSKREGFGRVLACGVCGERMYHQSSRKNPEYATYKCRKVKHGPGEASVSVMVHAAHAFVEEGFLRWFGDHPHTVMTFRDDDSERLEAVSAAQVRIAEIRRRQDDAVTDEEEEALARDYLAAKKALRAAEALPTNGQTVETETGETVRDVWERSSESEREALILRRGRWFIRPGRLPLSERLVWVPAGAEGEWSPDAVVEWLEKPVGVSLSDVGAGITVRNV